MTIIAPLPFTLTNGTTADASEVMADLNQIRNDINSAFAPSAPPAQGYSGAVVWSSVNQTVAINADVQLTFDTENIDTASIFNIISPTRLTVPAGVTKIRLLAATRYLPSTDGGQRVLFFKKNGTALSNPAQSVIEVADTTNPVNFQIVSSTLDVLAGNYFEVTTRVNASGGTYAAQGGSSMFEMQILG